MYYLKVLASANYRKQRIKHPDLNVINRTKLFRIKQDKKVGNKLRRPGMKTNWKERREEEARKEKRMYRKKKGIKVSRVKGVQRGEWQEKRGKGEK